MSKYRKQDYSRLITAKIGKRLWVVKEPWRTPFGTVPSGTNTDGASIPRIAWIFAGPGDELFEASVIHDWMYNNGIENKEKADEAFYETALAFGVTPWKAKVAYTVVSMFGKGRYAA
jgi:hypothetical protein